MVKPKLAIYWASSCGGCEIAVLNLQDRFIAAAGEFELVFCPCLLDTKRKDVEALPAGWIDITLFNGAIRTEENLEMARLLREKSRLLVAFGACATGGGIPALANLTDAADLLAGIYRAAPALDNPQGHLPQAASHLPEGILTLPTLRPSVGALSEAVGIDYLVPGCPPEPDRIWDVLQILAAGRDLPPRGSVLGGGESTVCQECGRRKEEKKIARFFRPHEITVDPALCLLEQGVVCAGIATRSGCGALCPAANVPCGGCYGPPDGVPDQGAALVAALGSIADPASLHGLEEGEREARIDAALAAIPDPAGSFYRYSLAAAALRPRGRSTS